MVKESVKKCSHCGHNGHNSRTCNGKVCFKLFGVKIETEKPDLFIKKSKSTGDLATYNVEQIEINDGYLSDGLIHTKKTKAAHEKKKGIPWNEEEHQCFLVGLEKLGKGDWKGISKEYVPTTTPTQVASHAQKYFIRMAPTYKKRRSSLFDTPLKDSAPLSPASPVSPTKTIVEASQQLGLSASQVAPLKKTIETQAQASTSAQVAKLKDASRVLPMAATYGVPSFPHMPYMVGPLPAANVMTTLPFVGVMNYPNQSYIYLPKINENFTNCEPFMYQFSQPLPHGSSQACPGSSVTKKDGQELSIGVI